MNPQFMVKFHKDHFEMGPYTLQEMRSKLASGALGTDYLVQRKGEFGWTTLGKLLGDQEMPKAANVAPDQALASTTSSDTTSAPGRLVERSSSLAEPANKSARILTAVCVTIALGAYFAYQDVRQGGLPYQSHPIAVIITDLFCGFLVGLIYYAGSGWLAKRKDQAVSQTRIRPDSNENAASDFVSDDFYDQVASELQHNNVIPGLWTKAYAEMNGDDAKTRALYIKYRVAQLVSIKRQGD